MSNKTFIIVITVIAIGFAGFIAMSRASAPAAAERPGIEQTDKGRKHVAETAVKYDGPEPPTSGDHANNLPWQIYSQEIPDVNVIHNLEHGGIYISYRPDLPAEYIAKISALFGSPYSREGFSPSKAIAAPRAANESPIILSSWNRSLKLEQFDEEKMVEYYLRNVGKAPEGSAP